MQNQRDDRPYVSRNCLGLSSSDTKMRLSTVGAADASSDIATRGATYNEVCKPKGRLPLWVCKPSYLPRKGKDIRDALNISDGASIALMLSFPGAARRGPAIRAPSPPSQARGVPRAGSTQAGTLKPRSREKLIPAPLEGGGRVGAAQPRTLTQTQPKP